MRLAFCFLSNRVDRFHQLDKSFNYSLQTIWPTCVKSFTKNVLFNPPMQYCNRWGDWNVEYRTYHWKDAFDMFTMRQESFYMARSADVIFIGDDDFIFGEFATENINQVCEYMEDNRDCGAVYLCGNLGGIDPGHGSEVYINNHPYMGMARGIMTRNRPVILDNRFHALGCGFDALVGITALMQGYYVARRMHFPIDHIKDDDKLLSDNQKNINYNLHFMKTEGIWSKLYAFFGQYERGQWPPGIFRLYRTEAMKKGFIPVYSETGEIL